MKFIAGMLFGLLAVSSVMSLPAGTPQDDAEVISVPQRRRTVLDSPDFHDFKGVIDTGAGYPFMQPNPHTFAFNLGFFDSFEDIFRRLRTRLWPVLSNGEGSDDAGSAEAGDAADQGGFTLNLNPFSSQKGNTTSTVKVVDGHRVEVNETVYGDDNSVFKVRMVNVRPLESGEEVKETVLTDTGSTEVTTKPQPANAAKPADEEPEGGFDLLNPVTSSPKRKINEFDDSDERREPLDKKTDENEIRSDIDGQPKQKKATAPTQTQANTNVDDQSMLPTTNTEAEPAAFVTDNSLKDDDAGVEAAAEMVTIDEEHDAHEQSVVSHLLAQAQTGEDESQSTIENNNEETDVKDDDDGDSHYAATTTTAVAAQQQLSEIKQYNANNGDAETVDDDDNNDNDKAIDDYVKRVKQREDAESSDDESAAETFETNPTYNAEWGTIHEQLAQGSDEVQNELDNDIDAYDTVPIDLSNDITVNDAAANDPDFELNPDAEFIDVGIDSTNMQAMPKFEQLTLSTAMDATRYSSQTLPMEEQMK